MHDGTADQAGSRRSSWSGVDTYVACGELMSTTGDGSDHSFPGPRKLTCLLSSSSIHPRYQTIHPRRPTATIPTMRILLTTRDLDVQYIISGFCIAISRSFAKLQMYLGRQLPGGAEAQLEAY
ncbi:hypothetical protein C8Q73DRAFT_30858 [Cubamyces lactineus]|nr:hypothetical protein C8Q73DRAFT_30858 [Cubamyces lactineus]